MENQIIVQELREEASRSKASNAVLHVFALRQRARDNFTISGLKQRMKTEGFHFEPREYESIVKTLAKLGLGTISSDSKGRIRGLKNIKVTLQSIGIAACGNEVNIEDYKKRLRLGELHVHKTPVHVTQKPKVLQDIEVKVLVNGKPVCITMSEGVTSSDVAHILDKFTG